jgi:predicted ATP-binding protein involved in virulence
VISPTTQQLQLSEDELRGKLQRLEEKRSRLMSAGLLNQETDAGISFDQEIASNTKAVLAVYAEDTEQKLGIFDELVQKIDLLSTIINNRFLYKTMAINKENGLVFTTKNGIVLPLENLSSGEQHELVLFYDLLFRVTSGSLILIDEPELSLYVVWQEKFLEDVQQITKLADIDIILATHSPDIISNRRDLVVELEGPVNGKLQ